MTLGAETVRWDGWPACPCGCPEQSMTLTRFGHVRGCRCHSCIGRRNRKKGQAAQAKSHRGDYHLDAR